MATETSRLPILDHLVVLVPYHELQELPKRLESSLIVVEGGSHSDGLTLNKLIILPDGTYIELIAFRDNIDPERRKKHMWGTLKECQISDWAYTLQDEKEFAQVQDCIKAESSAQVTYQEPIPNGRLRPDGVELKWALSSAQDASLCPLWPGMAPFWCLDRTPRHLRVPYREEISTAAPFTKHPSGAYGISQVFVSVPQTDFLALSQVYEGVHGPAIESDPARKVWSWINHAGSDRGKQKVILTASSSQERHIGLTLVGDQDSPHSIQILEGLAFDFDVE
ncbi:unnamed protein product [Clonostachys solani]|uniref:Glyoxalase-like domain-containing protein n=1 Tax=Clonostachys solani TaxID=160281 RepID=A0A9P0EM54_9HYPO|nr:unnamed protein product [Clonostachys solani]